MKVIESKNKSLLDSTCEILVHQVNCQGVMGSGIAKTIRQTYPVVYEHYKGFCDRAQTSWKLLGMIDIVKVSDNQSVCNLFGQHGFGSTERNTSYDAAADGFARLLRYCLENKVSSIAIPVNMGCALGGGNWAVYKTIILETFKDAEIEIEFCEYNPMTSR